MESSGSSCGSSDDDSFDEEGPATYQEWKAFVVKTYLNGKDPVRKIYEVSDNLLLKGQESKIQPQPQQPSRPHSRLPYQVQQPQSLTLQKNPLKHQLPPQPNKSDGNNFKAKVAKKANQPSPQSSRLISNPLDTQKADLRHFKVPDRDASGNPITFQTTSNPFAISKPTTIGNNPTITKNNNTSMTSNHNFATVTSSNLNKFTGVQMSSSIPSSSRVTKGSTYPENNIIPIAKPTPAAHLKTRSDVFWSLNSAAKLLHVKAQLDEASKIYVDKLVKNNGIAQREILKLRKDKQDLLNTIKMVEKVISDPTGAHHSS